MSLSLRRLHDPKLGIKIVKIMEKKMHLQQVLGNLFPMYMQSVAGSLSRELLLIIPFLERANYKMLMKQPTSKEIKLCMYKSVYSLPNLILAFIRPWPRTPVQS